MSFLPSQHVQPHCCVCHRDCKEQRIGRKVGTLIRLICLLPPYSPFQLSIISAGAHVPSSHIPSVSFFPASSSRPTAAGGKSQPLSGETAAAENWSLSSIIGVASRAGSLPILALLWLLDCSFTHVANRQTSCIPPTKPGSVWVFSQASEMINSYTHRGTDSTGRWSKSQISG